MNQNKLSRSGYRVVAARALAWSLCLSLTIPSFMSGLAHADLLPPPGGGGGSNSGNSQSFEEWAQQYQPTTVIPSNGGNAVDPSPSPSEPSPTQSPVLDPAPTPEPEPTAPSATASPSPQPTARTGDPTPTGTPTGASADGKDGGKDKNKKKSNNDLAKYGGIAAAGVGGLAALYGLSKLFGKKGAKDSANSSGKWGGASKQCQKACGLFNKTLPIHHERVDKSWKSLQGAGAACPDMGAQVQAMAALRSGSSPGDPERIVQTGSKVASSLQQAVGRPGCERIGGPLKQFSKSIQALDKLNRQIIAESVSCVGSTQSAATNEAGAAADMLSAGTMATGEANVGAVAQVGAAAQATQAGINHNFRTVIQAGMASCGNENFAGQKSLENAQGSLNALDGAGEAADTQHQLKPDEPGAAIPSGGGDMIPADSPAPPEAAGGYGDGYGDEPELTPTPRTPYADAAIRDRPFQPRPPSPAERPPTLSVPINLPPSTGGFHHEGPTNPSAGGGGGGGGGDSGVSGSDHYGPVMTQ